MRKVQLGTWVGIVLFALVGCSGAPNLQINSPQAVEIKSEKPRIAAPVPVAADQEQLSSDNRAFAFDLYQPLRKKGGNVFYSPYSISLALAMTFAGARGETAQQMAQALHFGLAPERLHPAFNNLDLLLAKRGQGAQGKDGKGFRLNIANALWGQAGYQFQPDFLNLLAENYGAGLRLLDFQKAPEPARVTINNWVGDRTEGKIKDLLAPGSVDTSTRLVLTNAIYFNAAWLFPFDKNATADGPFTLLDGGQISVPLMKRSESFRYAEGPDYQAVELPYDGRQLSMVILLPAAGRFESFGGSLDARQVDAILGNLSGKQVVLTLPRFKYESSFQLNQALAELGMRDAFLAGRADFSGMTGTRELYIGAVIHKAFVSVDEAGTEAAAATAVVMLAAGMAQPPVQMKVDRPFLFLIRDNETGAILFLGRVVNPGG